MTAQPAPDPDLAVVDQLEADPAHVLHVADFWGDPLKASGAQRNDGKSAYVEVYLGDRWFIFDPSGVAIPMGFVRFGTGRDAAGLMREVESWIEAEMRRLDPEAYPAGAAPAPRAAPAPAPL